MIGNPKQFAKQLLLLRQWEQDNLPHQNSMIARDIMVLVLAKYSSGTPLTIKDVHLTLGYSEDRVGEMIKQFTKDGFLIVEKDINDRRIKTVKPNHKLISLFEEYEIVIHKYMHI